MNSARVVSLSNSSDATDHPVQLLAFAFDEEEPTEIPAMRLQEDRLEALDILLGLLRAKVLNELAEDFGRTVLASSSRGSEAHENAVVRHDTPPLTRGRLRSRDAKNLGRGAHVPARQRAR